MTQCETEVRAVESVLGANVKPPRGVKRQSSTIEQAETPRGGVTIKLKRQESDVAVPSSHTGASADAFANSCMKHLCSPGERLRGLCLFTHVCVYTWHSDPNFKGVYECVGRRVQGGYDTCT